MTIKVETKQAGTTIYLTYPGQGSGNDQTLQTDSTKTVTFENVLSGWKISCTSTEDKIVAVLEVEV